VTRKFRRLHGEALKWLSGLPDGTMFVAAPQNVNGDPAAVLGCVVVGSVVAAA
jgi:hypothetical protein